MSIYFIPKYREKSPIVSQEELKLLDASTNLQDMMIKLTKMIELPSEELKDREAISSEIHGILKKYYPDCGLAMFGSSMTGFGVKNCDLDLLFVPYPEYCEMDRTKLENLPPPDPDRILSGETPRDILYKLESWSHYKFVKMILKKEKPRVKRVVMIPIKTPTLKVQLSESKVHCEIHVVYTTYNKSVIYNSELFLFLEKFDPRIKPLVMTLRYWAHALGFAKRSVFANYGFTLLIIFYLQNTSPPILPPIQLLMDHAGCSRMSEGWQTAFSTDVRLIKKSKNTQSLSELLIGFFDFYWNFDFVQNIISPISGKALPVKAVKDATVEKLKEFELSCINIQDPFVLSQNVSKLDNDVPLILFKFGAFMAKQFLQNPPETNRFSCFFNHMEYQRKLDVNYGKYVIGQPRICFINIDYDCFSHLSKNSKFTQQLWYEKVSEAVYEVLQYGLLIECEVTDKVDWAKNVAAAHKNGWKSKMQDKNDNTPPSSEVTPFELELIQSLQCFVYSRTWMGRKKFSEVVVSPADDVEDFNSSALKAEHSVSRELIRNNPTLSRPIPLMCFKVDIYKHILPQVNNVVLLIRPLTLSKEFFSVSYFLASYIPKTVKKILQSN